MDRSKPSQLVWVAARYLGIGAAVFGLEMLFSSYRLASLILCAFLVDFLGRRDGLRWDETEKGSSSSYALASLRGFALGATLSLGILLIANLLGWCSIAKGRPDVLGLLLGLVVAFAQAARDELLFRGVPLGMMRGHVPDRYALPYTAILGAVPWMLMQDRTWPGVVLIAVLGALFAYLWRSSGGLFVPWGAHAGWLFMTGPGARGLLFDTVFKTGRITPPERAEGPTALFAIATITAVTAGYVLWRQRASE